MSDSEEENEEALFDDDNEEEGVGDDDDERPELTQDQLKVFLRYHESDALIKLLVRPSSHHMQP